MTASPFGTLAGYLLIALEIPNFVPGLVIVTILWTMLTGAALGAWVAPRWHGAAP